MNKNKANGAMKIFTFVICVMLVTSMMVFAMLGCKPKADYTVGIIQLLPHGALDKANQGFQEELTRLMTETGKTVAFDNNNAQGEASNNTTIADKLVTKRVDLIYAIATPSAQAVANATQTIPVIANAVTDLVSAGLVDSNEKPGRNVSGCSDINPIAKQFELMMELVPNAKTFGVMYTAAESNSAYQAKVLKEECDKHNINLIVKTINDINEIDAALGTLSKAGVECLYIPTDNILAESSSTVHSCNIASNYNLPIVFGEAGPNKNCGVATYGVDYTQLGKIAAKMAFDILVNGKDISTMPVQTQTDNFEYNVNENIAKDIGFTIPQSVLDRLNK